MRTEQEIIKDIAFTYSELSPENLYCDGEISVAQGNRKGVVLKKKLQNLFNELGRYVDECDAYSLNRKNRGW